ncbi:MAG: hypothetical protein IJ634_03430 [Bacteroidales bacterium]|nr:hypothetical protein [Bacteroidales bacterium]
MKKTVLFLLMLAAAGFCRGQEELRGWNEGALTWGDFRGGATSGGAESYLRVVFGYEEADTVTADGIR